MTRACLYIAYDITTASYTQTLLKTVDDTTVTELRQELRERPNGVFAILSSYHSGSIQPCGTCTRKDVHNNTHSIAFWSPSWEYYDGYHPHDLLHDYYRPGTQSGHLIADSCGGPRCCKNLVPMRTETNLSQWKTQFESELSRAPGFSICKITCTYNDGLDPRIPTRIGGQSINFQLSDLFEADAIKKQGNTLATLVGGWLQENALDLKTSFDTCYATPRTLHEKIRTALSARAPNDSLSAVPLLTRIGTHQGSATQSVMIPKAPSVTVDSGKLWALLDTHHKSRTAVDYSGVLGLTPFREDLISDFRSAKKIRQLDRKRIYALPPRHKRPYEVLDYLALKGLLDDCVQNENGSFVAIDGQYLLKNFRSTSFTQEMKALIIVTNQWFLRQRESDLWSKTSVPVDWLSLQGNIYRSDAKNQGDPGDIGDGIVLDPQIDHIAPVSPSSGPIKPKSALRKARFSPYARPYSISSAPTMDWGFHRGPSIFSNAQLTSPQFNNKKRNRYYLDDLCLIYAKELPDEVDISFDMEEEYTFKSGNDMFSLVDEIYKTTK